MLTFQEPQALWLLLLAPLLALARRRASRVRRVVEPLLPILAARLAPSPRTAPRAFRLSPRQRVALNAASVALLALAAAGARWTTPAPEPGQWIVVLDNAAGSAAPVGGRPLLDRLEADLEEFAAGLPPGDALRVVATGPEPRLFRHPEDGDLATWLAGVRPALGAAAPEEVARLLAGSERWRPVRGRVLLSPRAGRWRGVLGRDPAWAAPPERGPLAGNAGITAFDLRPSGEAPDRYDLFFEVRGPPATSGALRASVLQGGREVAGRDVSLDHVGRGGARWEGLSLAAGPVTLALGRGDAFPGDDRVEALVRDAAPVAVGLAGAPVPFLAEALASHPGFRTAAGGAEPDVRVYGGQGPERLDRPALVIAPRGAFLGLAAAGRREAGGAPSSNPTHPVTRDADFRTLHASTVGEYAWAPDDRVLAALGGAPLVVAGRRDGHRLVVWNFDPVAGGFALDPAFVVLLRGSVEWLAGRERAAWAAAPGCPDGEPPADPLPDPTSAGEGAGNLLCAPATEEAREITVPDLAALAWPEPEPTRRSDAELRPLLAAAALALLLYGALVNAYASDVG